MKTRYFTFGQAHVHSVSGITFDKDCVAKVTSKGPRETANEVFGRKWCAE